MLNLKFSPANVKIKSLSKIRALKKYLAKGKRKVYSLDTLSGHNCPYANECLSKAVVTAGKRHIEDGPNTLFRCFSASQEVLFTGVYNLRDHNGKILRNWTKALSPSRIADLIESDMPANLGILRIHVAGDFFNQTYFDAMALVAGRNQDRLFYAYTKSLPFWVKRLGGIPDNFILTASRGGRKDKLIEQHNLRSVKVVFSKKEARTLGLKIDHDDSCAANPLKRGEDFALLIHGVQPAGSFASKALKLLKGVGSYSRKGAA